MKFIKRFCSKLNSYRLYHARRGQAAVLYALLTPIFLLFIGVAFDLGWYYLNVSRLQNAADAAAVAGAQTILEGENFSDYKSVALVGAYPGKSGVEYDPNDSERESIEDSNSVAADYASKNLSRNASWTVIDGDYILMDSWSADSNSQVVMTPLMYKESETADDIYYVVKLKENIRHFFLPGWFDAMNAPVTAVALLSKNAVDSSRVSPDSDESDENPSEKPQPNVKPQAINEKPIPIAPEIEVPDEVTEIIETVKNRNTIVGNWEVQKWYKDNNGIIGTNTEGKEYTKFSERYGYDLYTERWNIFQDLQNHYTAGDLYRKETVNIWDDVEDNNNSNGRSDKYGGKRSSVQPTNASGGNPYIASALDSIDVDFKPETTFSEGSNAYEPTGEDKSQGKNWDLPLGYTTGVNSQHKKWAVDKNATTGILRIHSSLNFGAPYKQRPSEQRPEEAKSGLDILWVRIESEPMLFYPDAIYGFTNSNVGRVGGMSSVRQIIININERNDAEDDRPVVMFYDGPEAYNDGNADLRASQPVILNLNQPFCGVLYAPNSPVVVIGDNKSEFKGFVVAREYKRLKTTADFERELAENRNLYTREGDNFTAKSPSDNPYKAATNSNTIYWKYTKITDENGIEMYVDNYGNVVCVDDDPPTDCGKYDNFGRTEFSIQNYIVESMSSTNMLLSGNDNWKTVVENRFKSSNQ